MLRYISGLNHVPVKFRTFEMLALLCEMRMKSMCTINCVRNPLLSENRQRLPIIGTYLRITVCLRVRGWLSPRRILIVRDSPRKILDGSFLPASLLEHIARYFNVPPTPASPLPSRQLLPFGNTYNAISYLPASIQRRLPPDFIPKAKLSTYERW